MKNDLYKVFDEYVPEDACADTAQTERVKNLVHSRLDGQNKNTVRPKVSVLRRTVIGIAAAALLCGTAVAAANIGWLDKVFGDSAAIVEDNRESYSVEITDASITSLPQNEYVLVPVTTIGDILSDGEMLLINFNVDLGSEEAAERLPVWAFGNKEFEISSGKGMSSVSTKMLERNGSTVSFCLGVTTDDGINPGDRVRLVFGYMGEDGLNEDNVCDTEICFNVVSVPQVLAKTYSINEEAEINGEEFTIESITVSPFKFSISGKNHMYGNERLFDESIYSFRMKDGSVITLPEVSTMSVANFKNDEGSHLFVFEAAADAHFNDGTDFSQFCFEAAFGQVIDTDDLVSVSVGDKVFELK